jgi:hypothetical protein
LLLYNNQLVGTIPSSLGALTALKALWLDGNNLNGTIPSSLGTLTVLNELRLQQNQLSGTIPSSLGALTALTHVRLYANQLVGQTPFCNSVQSITNFVADCAKVNCTCCTACCPAAFGIIPDYLYCDF